jgi:hypothetical protein
MCECRSNLELNRRTGRSTRAMKAIVGSVPNVSSWNRATSTRIALATQSATKTGTMSPSTLWLSEPTRGGSTIASLKIEAMREVERRMTITLLEGTNAAILAASNRGRLE